jgi:hypothetical protein
MVLEYDMTKGLRLIFNGESCVDIIDDPRYRHSVTGSDAPECAGVHIVHGSGLVRPRMTVTPRL